MLEAILQEHVQHLIDRLRSARHQQAAAGLRIGEQPAFDLALGEKVEVASYGRRLGPVDGDIRAGEAVQRTSPDAAGYDNMLAPDRYRHQLDGYPLSKYMLKFMAEGKQIYYVHYRTTVPDGGNHGG